MEMQFYQFEFNNFMRYTLTTYLNFDSMHHLSMGRENWTEIVYKIVSFAQIYWYAIWNPQYEIL